MTVSTVQDIVIYPIKSCRGISLNSATICAQGLLHDHTFLIVSKKTSESPFVTVDLKQCPALVHVRPSIDSSRLRITHIPSGSSICVDLEPNRQEYTTLKDVIKLWLYPYADALDLGTAAGSFFKEIVKVPGHEVKLCYRSDKPRPIAGNMPPATAQNGRQIEAALHEAFPLLLTSSASLDELNSRPTMTTNVPMERFRSNIIIDGCEAWDEDDWAELMISSKDGRRKHRVHLTARCGRCVITTIDHLAAKIGIQPLKELRSYRKIDHGDAASSPVFGMYGGES